MPTTPKKRHCVDGTCRHAYCKGEREGSARGFTQGVGYAVAEIIRSHDEPSVAVDVAMAAGFTYGEYVRAGLSEYDLKTLRKLRREEQRFPREKA